MRYYTVAEMDITDPGFWELGLRLHDEMVSEAETLAG